MSASRYLRIRYRKLPDATAELCRNASTPGWRPTDEPFPAACRLLFERLERAMHEAHREVTARATAEDWAAVLSGLRAGRL